jgi:hypothetical protein
MRKLFWIRVVAAAAVLAAFGVGVWFGGVL